MELTWNDGTGAGVIEHPWRDLRHAGEEAQARALTLNLICRTHDAADATRMAQCLWDLGPRHPARVFLVAPGAEGVKLRAAAHPRGSELVEMTLAPERGASLVVPLLATDLPVVLLWRGPDPTANAEFQQWAGVANRVLVDAHRLRLSPARLAALARELPPGPSLTDLTWTRLTPWRQLLCQGLETELHSTHRITSVTIASGGCGGRRCNLAGTLFAGWMAHQLQWGPQQRLGPNELRLNRPQGPPVRLRFEPAAEREALLRRVTVEGESNGMSVAIEHHGPHIAMTVLRAGEIVGHWAGAAAGEALLRGESDTLCEELSIHGADLLYQQSLERGLELVACLEADAA